MSNLLIGTQSGVFRLENGGNLQQELPPQFDVMVRQIAVDDTSSVFIAAGPELFASYDAGDSWQRLAEGLPTVQALVAV